MKNVKFHYMPIYLDSRGICWVSQVSNVSVNLWTSYNVHNLRFLEKSTLAMCLNYTKLNNILNYRVKGIPVCTRLAMKCHGNNSRLFSVFMLFY